MNTDKIYAEAIANEYAHKNTTKVVFFVTFIKNYFIAYII